MRAGKSESAEKSIVTRSYTDALSPAAAALRKADVEAAAGAVRQAVGQAFAPETRRGYRNDWTRFEAWRASLGSSQVPETSEEWWPVILAHLGHLRKEGLALATLERAQAAIVVTLRREKGVPMGHAPEPLKLFFQGIRRDRSRTVDRKRAMTVVELAALQEEATLLRVRNRAMLLVGFAGAFRRSEVVGLDREDVEVTPEGLRVTVRWSKTDQEGKGREVGLPRDPDERVCPVVALARWLKAAREAGCPIVTGPLFRPVLGRVVVDRRLLPGAVARAVKAAARELGLPPEAFAGHSLRSGYVTTAAKLGAGLPEIMRQTGHRNSAQVLEYVRFAGAFDNNPGTGGLSRLLKKDREP